MKTYQDLLEIGDNIGAREDFIVAAIYDHKGTPMYREALDAEQYYKWRNPTIMRYRKFLYTMTGKAVPDNYSANHKCAGNFYDRFVTQEVQYLLGNGVTFADDKVKDKLGRNFDTKLQEAALDALIGGVAFGFWNLDHLDVYKFTEFVPLWDEEDGALKAGIRFWQIAPDKPLRATLFELDGYTDFIRREKETMTVLRDKRPYTQIVKSNAAGDYEVFDGESYPSFPIIPLWASNKKQSTIVGLREQIDCYDLIKSGFANDLDDAQQIYWVLTNAGGMDDVDAAKFIERLKTTKTAIVDDDAQVVSHTVEVPYQSRQVYLTTLEKDMYRDAMAVNTDSISAGNVTATAIVAAYQCLDDKCDSFEFCVTEFIQGILALMGIDDDPVYKRNRIANQLEETQMVLSAAEYLDNETVLKHLPFLSPDEISGILDRTTEEEAERFAQTEEDIEENTAETPVEEVIIGE